MEPQRNANYMVHMRVGQCQAVLSRSKETKLEIPGPIRITRCKPRVLELESPKSQQPIWNILVCEPHRLTMAKGQAPKPEGELKNMALTRQRALNRGCQWPTTPLRQGHLEPNEKRIPAILNGRFFSRCSTEWSPPSQDY